MSSSLSPPNLRLLFIFWFLVRPASLWKITIMTVVSLQLIVWSVSGSLIPIMSGANVFIVLMAFTTTFVTVLINIYIGLPIMQLLFGQWLRVPRSPIGELSYLHLLLDVGLNKWQRLLVMFIYYGLCVAFGFSSMYAKNSAWDLFLIFRSRSNDSYTLISRVSCI